MGQKATRYTSCHIYTGFSSAPQTFSGFIRMTIILVYLFSVSLSFLKSIILSVPVVTHPKSPSVLCLHFFHVIFNNLLIRPLLKSSPSHLLPFIITRTPPLDSPSSVLRHYDFNFGCFVDLPLFFLFLLFFMKLFPPLVLYDQH